MTIKPEIQQRIVAAAEELVAEGVDKPTNEQVRERLGGGSLSHISPVMREWRESQMVTAVAIRDMPKEIRTVLERVGAELWRSASQLADEDVERIRAQSNEQLKAAHDERDEALREIERLEARITSMREDHEHEKAQVARLTEDNQTLATETATAKQRAEDAMERVNDLHGQLSRQSDQLETARGQVQQLQSAVDQLREDKASIGNQLATVESDLKSTTRELEAAHQRESRLQQPLEEVSQELSSLQQEQASLRSEQASTAKRNDELKEESATLRSTIDQLRASGSEANAELKTAREQIEELKGIRQELADTRTELAVSQAREEALRGQLDQRPDASQPTRGDKS